MAMLALLALLGLSAHSAGAVQGVRFVDSVQGAYLTGKQVSEAISQQQLQGLISAFTGLRPGLAIDGLQDQLLSQLVQPKLQKPRCHVALNLAGWSSGRMPPLLCKEVGKTKASIAHAFAEDVQQLFDKRQQVPAEMQEGEAHVAETVLELMAGLTQANPGVTVVSADDMAAQVWQQERLVQSNEMQTPKPDLQVSALAWVACGPYLTRKTILLPPCTAGMHWRGLLASDAERSGHNYWWAACREQPNPGQHSAGPAAAGRPCLCF